MEYKFSNANVLVVGDVMLDRYWYGNTRGMSVEAPVPIVNIQEDDDKPGGAGNVALNITSLQGKCHLIGISGKDEAGVKLHQILNQHGVQCHIQCPLNVQTIIKLRILSQQQQLLRLDFEKNFSTVSHGKLIHIFKDLAKRNNAVIFSDYGKGTLSDIQEMIKCAKQMNLPVVVDPKGNNYEPYRGATIIAPNLREFSTVIGISSDENTLIKKTKDFIIENDLQAILITRGDQGMLLVRPGQDALHIPAAGKDIYDVTGVSDTVVAVLGLALAAGYDMDTAARLANTAASIVVSKLGTATVTPEELSRALITLDNQFPTPKGIVTLEQLKLAVKEAKQRGEKIVMANGCFDLLHAGHVSYLQEAKKLGDKLVVAINDDNSIKRLKGDDRPLVSLEARLQMLAALRSVDWVIPFAEDTPEHIIAAISPSFLVKGGDYEINQVVGADIVLNHGGQVRVLKHDFLDCSTSAVLEKIKSIQPNTEDFRD